MDREREKKDKAQREAYRTFAAALKRCSVMTSLEVALITFRTMTGKHRRPAPTMRQIKRAFESFSEHSPVGAFDALCFALDDAESAPPMPTVPKHSPLEPVSLPE